MEWSLRYVCYYIIITLETWWLASKASKTYKLHNPNILYKHFTSLQTTLQLTIQEIKRLFRPYYTPALKVGVYCFTSVRPSVHPSVSSFIHPSINPSISPSVRSKNSYRRIFLRNYIIMISEIWFQGLYKSVIPCDAFSDWSLNNFLFIVYSWRVGALLESSSSQINLLTNIINKSGIFTKAITSFYSLDRHSGYTWN